MIVDLLSIVVSPPSHLSIPCEYQYSPSIFLLREE
jgi:hypothetical protein